MINWRGRKEEMEKVHISKLTEGRIKRARHAFRVISRGREIAVVFPGSTADLDTLEVLLSPELMKQLRDPAGDGIPGKRTTLDELDGKVRLARRRVRSGR